MRATEQDRDDVKEQRAIWHRNLLHIPVKNLVFLDESAASTALARLYGRSPIGERLSGSAPAGQWLTVSMLCAVKLDGPIAPLLVDGPIDGNIFTAWIEQSLLRELSPGDVVIMDNVSTHRVKAVSKLLASAEHDFFYLPPYSPDYNPIELMWSKVKTILRTLEARSYDELLDAMKEALNCITKENCSGYFKHCGYGINH